MSRESSFLEQLKTKLHSYKLSQEHHRKRLAKFRPVKVESESGEDEIKDYAKTTMNELLGWYGYEKLDTQETQGLNLRNYVAPGQPGMTLGSPSFPVLPKKLVETSPSNPRPSEAEAFNNGNNLDMESSICGAQSSPSPDSSENEADTLHGQSNESNEDLANIPDGCVICAWCQKIGEKIYTLQTPNGFKAFCSELCFAQFRRASFKKNKVCDWCKHVRHTVNYVDFQDGEQRLQFCSNKCLNQYKMNIFCKETQAHLSHLNHHYYPSLRSPTASSSAKGSLITPDLWLNGGHGLQIDGSSSPATSSLTASHHHHDQSSDDSESSRNKSHSLEMERVDRMATGTKETRDTGFGLKPSNQEQEEGLRFKDRVNSETGESSEQHQHNRQRRHHHQHHHQTNKIDCDHHGRGGSKDMSSSVSRAHHKSTIASINQAKIDVQAGNSCSNGNPLSSQASCDSHANKSTDGHVINLTQSCNLHFTPFQSHHPYTSAMDKAIRPAFLPPNAFPPPLLPPGHHHPGSTPSSFPSPAHIDFLRSQRFNPTLRHHSLPMIPLGSTLNRPNFIPMHPGNCNGPPLHHPPPSHSQHEPHPSLIGPNPNNLANFHPLTMLLPHPFLLPIPLPIPIPIPFPINFSPNGKASDSSVKQEKGVQVDRQLNETQSTKLIFTRHHSSFDSDEVNGKTGLKGQDCTRFRVDALMNKLFDKKIQAMKRSFKRSQESDGMMIVSNDSLEDLRISVDNDVGGSNKSISGKREEPSLSASSTSFGRSKRSKRDSIAI